MTHLRIATNRTGARLLPGLAAALLLLASLAACSPKTPQAMVEAAKTAYANGDTFGAMAKCQKLVERHPTDPAAQEARMLLASIHLRNGNAEEATRALSDIVDTEGGLQTEVAQRAYQDLLILLIRQDNAEALIAEVEKRAEALLAAPDFAWVVHGAEAQAYAAKGDTAKALEILASLIASAKSEEAALAAMGQSATILARDKKFDDAVTVFQDYLDAHPGGRLSAKLLADIASLHDAQAAAAEEGEARQAAQNKATAAREKAVPILRANYEQELAVEKRLVAGFELADLYQAIDQFEQAMQMLDALSSGTFASSSKQLDPAHVNVTICVRKSEIYRRQGDNEKALEVLKNGVLEHADSLWRWKILVAEAEIYLVDKEYDLARQIYEKLRDEFPNSETSQLASISLERLAEIVREQAAGSADGDTTATLAATAAGTTATAPPPPVEPAEPVKE